MLVSVSTALDTAAASFTATFASWVSQAMSRTLAVAAQLGQRAALVAAAVALWQRQLGCLRPGRCVEVIVVSTAARPLTADSLDVSTSPCLRALPSGGRRKGACWNRTSVRDDGSTRPNSRDGCCP